MCSPNLVEVNFDFVFKPKSKGSLIMFLGWSDDEEQDVCVCESFHALVLCVGGV